MDLFGILALCQMSAKEMAREARMDPRTLTGWLRGQGARRPHAAIVGRVHAVIEKRMAEIGRPPLSVMEVVKAIQLTQQRAREPDQEP